MVPDGSKRIDCDRFNSFDRFDVECSVRKINGDLNQLVSDFDANQTIYLKAQSTNQLSSQQHYRPVA